MAGNNPWFSVHPEDIIQGDRNKPQLEVNKEGCYSTAVWWGQHLSGSTKRKLCLCLGVSELFSYLSEFIFHCGEEDHEDRKLKWTSKEMEAWKSNQHIQSTPGYAWPNVSSNLLRAWIEQKREGRRNLLFLLQLKHPSSTFRNGAPDFQSFGFRLNYTNGFPGSPAIGCRTSWPP